MWWFCFIVLCLILLYTLLFLLQACSFFNERQNKSGSGWKGGVEELEGVRIGKQNTNQDIVYEKKNLFLLKFYFY